MQAMASTVLISAGVGFLVGAVGLMLDLPGRRQWGPVGEWWLVVGTVACGVLCFVATGVLVAQR